MHPLQKTSKTYMRKQKPLKTVYYNSKHVSSKSEVKKDDKTKESADSKKTIATAKLKLEASKIKDRLKREKY